MRRGSSFQISDLVTQIRTQREDLDKVLAGLQESAFRLREVARRSDADTSRKYLLFSGAYLRVTSAAIQALRRLSSFDRTLPQTIEPEVEETSKIVPRKRPQEPFSPGDSSDLDELYGEVLHG